MSDIDNKINIILNNRSNIPKFLYKYRPFDKYAIDMLENNCLFLCRAKDLDDVTECDVSFDMTKYGDILKETLTKKTIDVIIEHMKKNNLITDKITAQIYSLFNAENELKMSEIYVLMEKLEDSKKNGLDYSYWRIFFESVKDFFENSETEKLKFLVDFAIKAKESMGICSLSENYNDSIMWKNYAKNSTGYCVVYDMQNYTNLDNLFPVNYVLVENRNTNLIMQLTLTFIDYIIQYLIKGEVGSYFNGYISLFCTKYIQWSYQNEWRIIGEANSKVIAPKINRIIIGNNATKETIEILSNFCKLNKIKIERD